VLNSALYKYLREWRRNKSKYLGMAAFIIMHDTTLEDLCRKRPNSLSGIREVSGFGERKTELYGREILEVLKQFREGAAARPSISGQIEPSVARVAPAVNKADSNPKRKREAWWGAR
jgi:ATP-dependent DNA helicase RecQ